MSNNMYPNMPSAPEMEPEHTKVYPPLHPVAGPANEYQQMPPYPMPPPAYTEQTPILIPTQSPPTTVQTTIVVVDSFPSKAIRMKCYYCNEDITTKVKPQATCASWVLCSLLCLFGCFCGCCLLPFCTNGTRDIMHYCPKCKKYLGVHERMRFGRR